MTAVDFLKALKDFIKSEVADGIWLLKENTEKEYVHPHVYLMTLPHKNFIPVDFSVPFILIGLTDGSDAASENHLAVRILCATYSSINYDADLKLPDETGYIDLLNILERIKLKLVEKRVINGKGTVEKPINYGVYAEEVTYPFNYGYLTFGVQMPINEYPINRLL